MSRIQEVSIIAIDGLEVPDGLTEGSQFTITATLSVAKVDQEWVDVTVEGGKPEQLPGSVVLGCVATEWSAA